MKKHLLSHRINSNCENDLPGLWRSNVNTMVTKYLILTAYKYCWHNLYYIRFDKHTTIAVLYHVSFSYHYISAIFLQYGGYRLENISNCLFRQNNYLLSCNLELKKKDKPCMQNHTIVIVPLSLSWVWCCRVDILPQLFVTAK